jgi:hypothetical protein
VLEKFKKLHIKKIALALSLCLLVIWGLLGTGTSLAWFADSSQDLNNIFHFGTLDIAVGFRQPDGSYASIDERTDVFDPNAIFEPGYMQIVYLEVKNAGTCDFTFTTGVNVTKYTPATNVFGLPFDLQRFLLFGMVWAPTEDALRQQLSSREQVRTLATLPLNNYAKEIAILHPGETCYVALMVYMPESVGDAANYRGSAPTVELGLILRATQIEK